MSPSLDRLIIMMEYMGKDYFVIPHHNMEMPPDADGFGFRSEKMFRLMKDGTMTYTGWGWDPRTRNNGTIVVDNIKLDQRWIDRAYVFLIVDVRRKLRKAAASSSMKNVIDLIKKFNKLEFVNTDYEI